MPGGLAGQPLGNRLGQFPIVQDGLALFILYHTGERHRPHHLTFQGQGSIGAGLSLLHQGMKTLGFLRGQGKSLQFSAPNHLIELGQGNLPGGLRVQDHLAGFQVHL